MSSGTSFYNDSGFPFDQNQSATRALVSILGDDYILARLYELARNNAWIGRDTLRRRIHEDIKLFAKDLKGEASDDIQHAAARFVNAKADYASRCIANEEDPYQRLRMSKTQQRQAEKNIEDISEEEGAKQSDDDTDLENLEAFRRFLITSRAYVILQARIQISCLRLNTVPNAVPVVDTRTPGINARETIRLHSESGTLGVRVVQLLKETTASTVVKLLMFMVGSLLIFMVDSLLIYIVVHLLFMVVNHRIPMGCLEPPLKTGWTRITVECHVS